MPKRLPLIDRPLRSMRVVETKSGDGYKVVSDDGYVPPICTGIFDNPETAQASIERAERIEGEKAEARKKSGEETTGEGEEG